MSEKATTTTKKATAKSKESSASTDSSTKSGTDAATSSDAKPDAGSGTSSGAKSGGSSRSISYFSSVSTDDYRAGWDSIFNGADDSGNNKKPRQTRAKTRRAATPATIELELSELDADLRAQLEDAFRRKAKSKRINFDKHSKIWRLACDLGG